MVVIMFVVIIERHQEVLEHVVGNLHSLLRANVARVAEMNACPDEWLDHLCRGVGETVKRPSEAGVTRSVYKISEDFWRR